MQKIVLDQNSSGVVVKLIYAEGMFKSLVLDMSLVSGRLLYIGHGSSQDEAWNDANDFVKALARSSVETMWC